MCGGTHAPWTLDRGPHWEAQAGRTDENGTIAWSGSWVCVLVRKGRERMVRRKGAVFDLENIFAMMFVSMRGWEIDLGHNRVASYKEDPQLVTASILT